MTMNQQPQAFRNAPLRQAATFLAITYAGALALALTFPHNEIGALLTIVVPAIAVVITISVTERRGRRAAWRNVGFRLPRLRHFGWALGGPLLVVTVSFAAAWAVGVVSIPDPGEWFADEAMNVLVVTAIFTAVLIGEELGWRGYLQPRLQQMLPIRRAALVTGACHAVFHLPLLLLTTSYQSEGSRWIIVPMVMVTLTLAGVWYGWLRVHSGSIWPVALTHSAFNAVMESAASVAVASSVTTMAYLTTETGVFTLVSLTALATFLMARSNSGWSESSNREFTPST